MADATAQGEAGRGSTATPPRGRRRRALRLAVIALAVLVLLVALAPTILSLGVFCRYGTDVAGDRLSARIAADGWSLSWFGAQEVRGLSILLPDGQPVARAHRVTIDQGLLGLWRNLNHPGAVRVEKADLWTAGLSLWIKGLSEGAPPKAPEVPSAALAMAAVGPAPPIPRDIVIENATVHAGADVLRVGHARIEDDPQKTSRTLVDIAWELVHAGERGTGSLTGAIEGLREDWGGIGALAIEAARVTAENLPIDVLSAMAADFGVPVGGGGTLCVDATGGRTRTGDFSVQGECQGKNVWITGQALNGDRPTFETFRLTGTLARSDGKYQVTDLRFEAASVGATAGGTFAFPPGGGPPVGDGNATLHVAVAALARMLPNTLSIHKGLVVDAGVLDASLRLQSGEGRAPAMLAANVDLENLRGRRNGRPIALAPVHLVFEVLRDLPAATGGSTDARNEPPLLQALQVKRLLLAGAFGQVTAAGRLEDFQLDAQLDLARATEDLGRFVDLKGYGAAGTLTVHVESKGRLTDRIALAMAAEMKNVSASLGEGRRWQDPHATLNAAGTVAFDDKREPSAVAVEKCVFDGRTAYVDAKGTLSRAKGPWEVDLDAAANGETARLAALANLLLAPPASDAAQDTAGWRHVISEMARGGAGRWDLVGKANGSLGGDLRFAMRAEFKDLQAPYGRGQRWTDPQASFEAAGVLKFDAGGPLAAASIDKFAFAGTGVNLVASGALARAEDSWTYRGQPRLDGEVGRLASLAGLALDVAATRRPASPAAAAPPDPAGQVARQLAAAGRGQLHIEAHLEGDARKFFDAKGLTFTLTGLSAPVLEGLTAAPLEAAQAQVSGAVRYDYAAADTITATLSAAGRNINVALPQGSVIREDRLDLAASAVLTYAPAGDLTDVRVTPYAVGWPAGTLKGDAEAKPGRAGWEFRVTASGAGDIEPLAGTVARLLGRPAQAIRGRWEIGMAAYKRGADGGHDIEVSAMARGLAVPAPGRPATPGQEELQRLGDATVTASALVAADGTVRIRKADVAGPGFAVKATGTARLPSESDKTPAADGSGTATADLARLSKVLAPFGLLPDSVQFAGQADFAGDVKTAAGKVAATGMLKVADLSVQLAAEKISIQEPRVELRATFTHDPRERRWELAAEGIESAIARGFVRIAVLPEPEPARAGTAAAPAPAATRLDAACDLACGAERVRNLLGARLPDKLQFAGPWKISGRVSGALAPDGPWNQRIAGLSGDGAAAIGMFTYDEIAGGQGAVRWRMAEGRLYLNADPAQPSRLTVAGGTVNLDGVINLRSPVAHLVISQPLQVIDNVPLSDPGVHHYMKFATPILAGSIGSNGRLWGRIGSLDVPLSAAEVNQAAGSAQFIIEQFQTELTGPLATILGWYGSPTRTPVQRLGPIDVRLADGFFSIKEHPVVFGPDTALLVKGRIGLDETLNVEINIPLTAPILKRFGVPSVAAPYLLGQRLTVPLTGTIHKPQLDEKMITKRIGQMVAEAIKRKALEEIGGWLQKQLK